MFLDFNNYETILNIFSTQFTIEIAAEISDFKMEE